MNSTGRLPRIYAATALLVLLMASFITGCSSKPPVNRNSKDIVTSDTEKLLNRFANADPEFPSSLASNRDVYVMINAEPEYARVRLIGRKTLTPRRLAEILQRSVQGTLLAKRKVVWSQGRHFSAAKVWIRPYSKFRASGGYVYPIGAIVQAIRSEGLNPYVLLLSAKDMKVHGFRSSDATKNRRYHNLTSAEPDYRLDLTWRVPQREFYLAVLFYMLIPLLVIISTIEVMISSNPGIMRPLLRLLVFSFPFHWIAAYVLARFSVFPNAQQFWFSGSAWKAVFTAGIYDVLSVLIGMCIGMFICGFMPERRKVDKDEEEPSKFDPEDDYVDEREACDN